MNMKIVTLVENTPREGLHAARGLSLYGETASHKVLFDMGPGAEFLGNAAALGVDLTAVDTAVLSHGHSDHGGGLEAFCRVNSQAKLYLRREAFQPYYAVLPGQEPQYIGLSTPPDFLHKRAVFTDDTLRLDGELFLFSDVTDDPANRAAAPKLQEKIGGEFQPDVFAHEQHLILESGGKAVLLAGCAHKGIVNILAAAKRHLGRMPDAVFGGFHLFELPPDAPDSLRLMDLTVKALSEGDTVYYTGHCTGDWAYSQLKAALGERLQAMNCGTEMEI
jgi:7,8-dihydropterin-6-yl-methyl-4-(beta-D-ribofuranosyl)aminobenzene 5'-phosphate synthase